MPDKPRHLKLASDSADDEAKIARRDEQLIRGLIAGDAEALRQIITHYDRLVRFAVHRACRDECRRDPNLLDALASEVWTGFVDSIQRRSQGPTGTLKAYLAQIARNKTADHLRKSAKNPEAQSSAALTIADAEQAADTDQNPLATLIDFENIEALRACFAELPPDDRTLLKEIELLTQAKWSQAAARLGLAESTLRSRWKSVVDRLRQCMANKTTKEL